LEICIGSAAVSPVAAYLVQSLATLLGVVLLVGLIFFATRRLGITATPPGLELVARLPLEARRAVYGVRVKQRVFVMAANDHAITKLGELAADEFPVSEVPLRGAFGDALRRALSRPTEAPAAAQTQGPPLTTPANDTKTESQA
jgi:flagellar biogenesis protein FliO